MMVITKQVKVVKSTNIHVVHTNNTYKWYMMKRKYIMLTKPRKEMQANLSAYWKSSNIEEPNMLWFFTNENFKQNQMMNKNYR